MGRSEGMNRCGVEVVERVYGCWGFALVCIGVRRFWWLISSACGFSWCFLLVVLGLDEETNILCGQLCIGEVSR